MLYVKFYTSVFLFFNILCEKVSIMFMLPLHVCPLCDIINTHLFESFFKNKEGSHKNERPDLRDGPFLT